MLKALQQHFKDTYPPHTRPSFSERLTLLAAGTEVASTIAVANVAVPALSAVSTVAACFSGTPDMSLSGAEAADTCGALNLRQPPQVTALSVNEKVPDAAHVAKAEGGRPYLRWEHEGLTVLR